MPACTECRRRHTRCDGSLRHCLRQSQLQTAAVAGPSQSHSDHQNEQTSVEDNSPLTNPEEVPTLQEETEESCLTTGLTSNDQAEDMGGTQSRLNFPPTPIEWSESLWQRDDTRHVINRAVIPYLLTAMKCVHFLQPEKPLRFIGNYINTSEEAREAIRQEANDKPFHVITEEERHRIGYYVTPFALEGMNVLAADNAKPEDMLSFLGLFLTIRADEVEA